MARHRARQRKEPKSSGARPGSAPRAPQEVPPPAPHSAPHTAHPVGTPADRRFGERPVSRLEGFSDGVFAISATLLVVTLDVPRTYADLVTGVRGFVAFGLSFTMLLLIWFAHNDFFRRFGLADRTIALLNSALLFVVLFYVFPLKFLSLALVNAYSGHGAEAAAMVSSLDDWVGLMTIYGVGFASVFALLGLMYRHAHRCRELLDLSPREAFEARVSTNGCWIFVGVALVSITLAQLQVGMVFGLPGWIYCLIGPLSSWYGARVSRAREALGARCPPLRCARGLDMARSESSGVEPAAVRPGHRRAAGRAGRRHDERDHTLQPQLHLLPGAPVPSTPCNATRRPRPTGTRPSRSTTATMPRCVRHGTNRRSFRAEAEASAPQPGHRSTCRGGEAGSARDVLRTSLARGLRGEGPQPLTEWRLKPSVSSHPAQGALRLI